MAALVQRDGREVGGVPAGAGAVGRGGDGRRPGEDALGLRGSAKAGVEQVVAQAAGIGTVRRPSRDLGSISASR